MAALTSAMRVDPAMEDRGGEDRVGAAVADRGHEVGRAGGAARRDDRDTRPATVIARSSAVSNPAPVPSRSIEVTSSSPAPRSTARSAQATASSPVASRPPLTTTSQRVLGTVAPRVDGDDDGLAAEPARAARDQHRVGDGRGVERDLVGAGPQDVAHLVDGPHAAADGQRDERPARRPLDDVEERAAPLGGGGDVEEDELVGALGRVALGELGRIALVDEVDEAGALDHAPVGDVEARDHAAAEHQAARDERRRSWPAGAGRRRRCVPGGTGRRAARPRATAEANGRPWSVVARTRSSSAEPTAPAYEWTK